MTRFYDRTVEELEHVDLYEDRLSYPEAATYVGLPVATIRQWKSRRTLAPVAIDENGRLRFRPIDVLRAEATTRRRPQGRPRQAS